MGYYIDKDQSGKPLPDKGKANYLIENCGFTKTEASFKEGLVCVVENPFFDAAAYIFSEKEFNDFNDASDTRSKIWVKHPDAKILSGYEESMQ